MSDNIMRLAILDWMMTGEVGASSKAMAGCLAGMPCGNDYPLDPDDLRRCVLFLDAVPAARQHMDELKELSAIWAALVENWAALEASLRAEAVEQKADIRERYARWSARQTYRMMEAVIKKARKA